MIRFDFDHLTSEQYSSLEDSDFFVLPSELSGLDFVKNILVVYRAFDADSATFAQYYQSFRKLNNIQLLALPCSGNEILSDYTTFKSQIEDPIKTYIDLQTDEYGVSPIDYILIAYGVPGGFRDGSDIVASTSRLARLYHSYSKFEANPLFDRKIYQSYSSSDVDKVLLVSRIDAPTLDIAMSLINNTARTIKQQVANGTFFFNKDGVRNTFEDDRYYDDLTDFQHKTLPLLNMPVTTTVHWDEYTDVPLFQLRHDSIMWAWQSDRSGYAFFEDTRAARMFLYNADTDGAASIRDVNDKRWPMLAISSGYIGTAGSMSDPTADGYLRPRPFFEALFRGATLGEAFVLACPFLNWSVGLIGDPLITMTFPTPVRLSDDLNLVSGYRQMADELANSVAYAVARANDFYTIYTTIIQSADLAVKTELLNTARNLATQSNLEAKRDFSSLAASFIAYPSSNINNFLSANAMKLSSIILYPLGNSSTIDSNNLLAIGSWQFTDVVQHPYSAFLTYHFELQLAYDSNFDQVFLTADSEIVEAGWEYETEPSIYDIVPIAGVPSSFAGRHIRYTGQITLSRGLVYHARIRQIDNNGQWTTYRISTEIVNT